MADDLYKLYASPATVGDVLTTTANNMSKKILDVYFNKYPTLEWLEKNCKELVDGGDLYDMRLEYDKNNTVAFIAPNGTISTTPNNTLTTAYFKPCFLAGSATISEDDLSKNQGEAKIASLIYSRENNLAKTASETIARNLFNASPTAFHPNTFLEICSTSDPSRGALGNIPRATYTWWQSNSTALGSFSAVGISGIETMQRTIAPSQGMDIPDFGVTTSTVFGCIQSNLNNRVQLTNTKKGELGFENLKIGATTIVYDEFCPAGYLFLLNKNYIKYKIHSSLNKKMGPYQQAIDSWNKTRLFAHKFQICVSDPDKLGVLTGLTA